MQASPLINLNRTLRRPKQLAFHSQYQNFVCSKVMALPKDQAKEEGEATKEQNGAEDGEQVVEV